MTKAARMLGRRSSRPLIRLRRVDLPLPLGPTKAPMRQPSGSRFSVGRGLIVVVVMAQVVVVSSGLVVVVTASGTSLDFAASLTAASTRTELLRTLGSPSIPVIESHVRLGSCDTSKREEVRVVRNAQEKQKAAQYCSRRKSKIPHQMRRMSRTDLLPRAVRHHVQM